MPEVATILGIGRSTAYALVQRGELAAIRVGGRVVVARAEIDRLLGEDPAADERYSSTGESKVG